jgi:hypothetical protein
VPLPTATGLASPGESRGSSLFLALGALDTGLRRYDEDRLSQ